jgi:predicted nucleic acid-binding protein
MEQRYLIDTNAIIDAQMGNIPENGMAFMVSVINKEFNVSFVSYIEFLGYKNITPQSEAFISLATVIEINKNIIDTCIALRKSKRIDLPDAIIAATALNQNLIIVSRNTKDFENIEGLQIIDPHNL